MSKEVPDAYEFRYTQFWQEISAKASNVYVKRSFILILLVLFLYTIVTSFFVSGGNIRLGSSDRYINMEDYMVLLWCVALFLAAIVTPGKLCYVTFIVAIVVTILSCISNVPYSVDYN